MPGPQSVVRNPPWAYAAVIAAAFLAAVLVGYSNYGKQMNHYASDLLFRLRGADPGARDRIVIVAIDDATLRARGMFPLDRRLLARVLDVICNGRPGAIGVDFLITDTAPPAMNQGLTEALSRCEHDVLGAGLSQEPSPRWMEPLPPLKQAAAAVGHVHADPDDDGINRQILLEKIAGGTRHWALGFQLFRELTPAAQQLLETDDGLVWGAWFIPAPRDRERALLVNFVGGEGSFDTISFEDILQEKVRSSRFTGKAVLIGTTAQGFPDRQYTPFSTSGIGMPGVEIHANLLHTLLEQRFLYPLRESTALLLQSSTAAALAVALFYLRRYWLVAALAVLFVAVHVLPYGLFLNRQVAPAFSLALAFWFPALAGGTFQYLTVWRRYETADAAQRRLRRQMEFVTHEMRSPLTAIQGSSEVISRYSKEERARQMAGLIHRESQRLSKMVERYLNVERLSAGEIELQRTPVDSAALVEGCVERARTLAERKGITIEALLEDPGPALGDAELLEFALYNLLSNAVKYSPERSTVRVAARAQGGLVRFEVEDQGAGISRQDAARIFDRFYRTSDAESSGNPGLGLGLAIVREIARHHGGEVTVASELGKGSRFTLAIPTAKSAVRQ